MSEAHSATDLESIAVIGLAGRFPGADDVDTFWENIRQGREGLTTFSDEQLLAAGVPPELLADPNYVPVSGALSDVAGFDARLFDYTPREAELMDPQQRLFLETAWTALEHAGCDPEQSERRVGVFAGVSMNTYVAQNLATRPDLVAGATSLNATLGNNHDFLATRLAYKLNLKGPAFTVQTACSTSLVAIHLSCQSLLNGECDIALAGGASAVLPNEAGYLYQAGGIYSPDGRCRPFDAAAGGTVGGRGVGVVVLKRLADALADGDTIHALIRGSAVNNDGAAKIGFTAPSIAGQAEVIAEALAVAGVDAGTIGYVETHGTGTPLGDPIEVAALGQAFGPVGRGRCALGSVKANIGHLDAAAGVASFIKTVLAVKHGELPPSLHFETPNPEIDFASSPFYVNTSLQPWPASAVPRRAGVSSFGMGGTNAHVILEEAPAAAPTAKPDSPPLLVWSAKTPAALAATVEKGLAFLAADPDLNQADVAYTLQRGRRALPYRFALLSSDDTAAAGQSAALAAAAVANRPVTFMFTGQGAQYAGMGRDLYDHEPVFRRWFDYCAQILEPILAQELRRLLYETATDNQLQETWLTQPALFAVEYALAQVWLAWGVRPAALIGHSIGEYVAACLAGVFSLEDALPLVAARGRLMYDLPGGAMLAVLSPAAEVAPLLPATVSLAASNEAASCVVAGPQAAITALAADLAARGIESRRLATSHAFHSAMMDPILAPFTERVGQIALQPPQIPVVSNRSGAWLTAAEAVDPAYWADHLRRPVRFADGLAALLAEPDMALLEVGPGHTLAGFARRHPDLTPRHVVARSMRHPRETGSDAAFLRRSLGQLWAAGVAVDWDSFNAGRRARRLPLPTYPFERQRYWVDAQPRAAAPAGGKENDPARWFYRPAWQQAAPPATTVPAPQQWLILADDGGTANRLAERLRAAGHNVNTAGAGLAPQFGAGSNPPDHIVHCLTLDAADARTRGYDSLLALAQALNDVTKPVRLTVVSRGLFDVTGAETPAPAKNLLLGPLQVMPLEYPNLTVRVVDLDDTPAAVDHILAELAAADDLVQVAYRGGRRWQLRYARLAAAPADAPTRLRRQGVYVINGGLGGVGLETARFLANAAAARLALISRTPLPPRTEWAAVADPDIAGKIAQVEALEAAGAEVLLLTADAGDAGALSAALAATEAHFGAIHGVIHAAGGARAPVMLAATGRSTTARHFRPKVDALPALAAAIGARALDFCLVHSSLSAVLGAVGQAAYTAAHHFVDAFVRQQERQAPGVWQSVNWDNWLTWRDPAADLTSAEAALVLSAADGQAALARLFALPPLPGVVVSTGDLETRLARWVGREFLREAPAAADAPAGRYPRPPLPTPFVAPEGPVAATLAAIWTQVLGIAPIGADDNFFELGGDSVLGIQIIAKAGQAGIRLTPNQIFAHQTVAELAAAATVAAPPAAAQSTASGDVPLTAIQHWFFTQDLPDRAHFNLPLQLTVPADVVPERLARCLQLLADHHDALRLRFTPTAEPPGWRQFYAPAGAPVPLDQVDLSGVTAAEKAAVMNAAATSFQQRLDLAAGPLLRAVLFRDGDRPATLLLIAHHLVVDVFSWRILAEDLATVYDQLSRGAAPGLPPRTDSYQRWASAVNNYANGAAVRAAAAYWQDLAGRAAARPPFPVDFDQGPNDAAGAASLQAALTAAETTELLQRLPQVFQTQIADALLLALAAVVANWTGRPGLLVALEGHGRETIDVDLDLSRTVGWFTSLYPVYLELPAGGGRDAALKAVKEQLRAVPQRGLSYGLLRYLGDDASVRAALAAMPEPAINLLYLGQFDRPANPGPFAAAADYAGAAGAPGAPRRHLIELVAAVRQGRLEVEWVYGARQYRPATIQAQADRFLTELRRLLAETSEISQPAFTPSDFPGARLDQAQLDKLLAKFNRPEEKGNA